ncbi:MAG: tRNA uridine-5-carboxymethylaminomethyl(34) synthesis GTPase MnmE [Planctomycetes bacterium]|nr:tRNA uridine-5-carboxymethylaminomethyl(34) synthesis GTPase MnmE [Planctomycetota bacterium]
MVNQNDTILAVSTPRGSSLRAIIRISGPDALPCAMKSFTESPPSSTSTETRATYRSLKGYINLGYRGSHAGAPAQLYIMKAPRSYTREDVIEIHTIGSAPLVEALTEKLLQDARADGTALRTAEPGEFTKRAFLNGRIDMVQAEAVLRVIRSRTDSELRAAASQLEGGFSRELKKTHERITDLLSVLEASIDFSDQDVSTVSGEDALAEIEAIAGDLHRCVRTADNGAIHCDGVKTVLIGPPNAGKSSLFNALLGRPRAITSHKSGTTRDYLGADLVVDGTALWLLDTAGLVQEDTNGNEESGPETLAIDMTARAVDASSLFILVLDGSKPMTERSFDSLPSFPFDQAPGSSNCLLVINKADLPQRFSIKNLPTKWRNLPIIYTSALTGDGIGELTSAVAEKITGGEVDCSTSTEALNARQRLLADSCLASLEKASRSVKEQLSAEFVALDIREASDTLGEFLGKITTEDILERIFSQFCIGK